MKFVFSLSLYLLINLIFLFKYAPQQELVPVTLICSLFFLLLIFVGLTLKINSESIIHKNLIFYIVSIIFFILTIIINNLVDGYSLNVDRWSALHESIKSVLNGQYPYTSIDHLGGRSSHLPTTIIISIPFYYLGDVGYLQSFSFLLISLTMYMMFESRKRLPSLLLMMCSPCYLWGLYAKSDLMSNTIIILFFIVLIDKYKLIHKPILIGISFSALLLTRLYAIIPLSLSITKHFIKSSNKWKKYFIFSSIITLILLMLIVLYNSPNMHIIKEYNPIYLQLRNIPIYILFLGFISLIYFALNCEEMDGVIEKTIILILVPTLFYLLVTILEYGIIASIYNDIFDISYLGIIMPLLIYCIIANLPKILSPPESTATT